MDETSEYRVRVETADGVPVFIGRIGRDDHLSIVQAIGVPTHVSLTATGEMAFLEKATP